MPGCKQPGTGRGGSIGLLDSGTRDDAEASAARGWLADHLAGRRSLLLVDTNEQAARLSSSIRAELVRLGRVAEEGVRLGFDGTTAGVGDLVEARHNAHHLAGFEGNRRGPHNRDLYRVTAVRDDGALEVTTDTHGSGLDPAHGPAVGARLVLPATYVSEHLALGYAGTTHAGQGATVDTTHTVVTPTTRANSLYVGMSRGRDRNTAHITTRVAPDDPADGTPERHELHRDPVAVLAGILDTADQALDRSAMAIATKSAEEAESARTVVELLADAAQLAATERTAASLDRLVHDGALTGEQRARIAAEDGTAALTRVLRRAELAGLDPDAVLTEAVERGPLTGARNVSNVVYSRIRDQHRLDPVGERWTDWIPRTDNPEWSTYLHRLAETADQRADDLGTAAAVESPAWAVAAFGDVPVEPSARQRWCDDVGRVAAYREVRGHDDPTDALGPAPKPGQVEEFAAHRAVWRALGRPEIDREHLELSNGQLRIRVRAYDRELAAAPRYVANELAGTRQAAEAQRQDAAVTRAALDTAPDVAERDRLAERAAGAEAMAALLEQRAAQLQEIDDARGMWLAHTAQTRVQAELSKAELSARDAADDPDDRITAAEWKAAHDAAVAEDEQYREITEDDIHDQAPDDRDAVAVAVEQRDAEAADSRRDDVREIAGVRPEPVGEDVVRVPEAAETTDHLDHAGRILDEIRYRDTAVDDHDERAVELARWHTEQHSGVDDAADGFDEPELADSRW